MRIKALDGLRGLAILLVLAGHMGIPHLGPLAPLGVTLFFALSGYLITGILTRQQDQGGVRFLAFYGRRARRLLPALCVMLIGAAVMFGAGWWNQTWQALLYVGNWAPIHGRYLGNITHVWSLAVEEHFYLVWPLVIAVIPTRHRVRTIAVLVVLFGVWRLGMGAVASADRAYYGTDTNAYGLLAGCLISVAGFRKLSPRWGILATVGFLALGMFGTMTVGMLFLAVPLAALMVHVAATGMPIFEVGWLRWFGTVSYGLYLWHAPLFDTYGHTLLILAVSILAGWLSWILIERPALNWHLTETVDVPRLTYRLWRWQAATANRP